MPDRYSDPECAGDCDASMACPWCWPGDWAQFAHAAERRMARIRDIMGWEKP